MMPGMNAGALKDAQVDEKAMVRTEAIILSMTPYERENPSVPQLTAASAASPPAAA